MGLQERIARDLLSIGAVFPAPGAALHLGQRHQKAPFTAITASPSPRRRCAWMWKNGLARNHPQPLPGLRSADGHLHRRHRPRRHHRPHPRPAHGLRAFRGQGPRPRQPESRANWKRAKKVCGRRGPHLHRRQRPSKWSMCCAKPARRCWASPASSPTA